MRFSKEGQQALSARMRARPIHFAIVVMALFLSPVVRAQDDPGESKGIDSGDYNVHQSIEFGYRANEINGNKAVSYTHLASARPMKRRAMDAWILYQHEPEV